MQRKVSRGHDQSRQALTKWTVSKGFHRKSDVGHVVFDSGGADLGLRGKREREQRDDQRPPDQAPQNGYHLP